MNLIFVSILFLTSAFCFAQDTSDQIEKAVDALSPLAQGGVQVYNFKPSKSVKETLKKLAIATEIDVESFESGWTEDSSEAWEADGGAWAESNMKEAYQYIYTYDQDQFATPEEAAKYKKLNKTLRSQFELLMNTGVQFGIAPIGAIQCGTTFAALVIIDPNSGKVYVFTAEPSGEC